MITSITVQNRFNMNFYAQMGKLELNHPFETVDKKFPTIEEQTAITIALTKLGYVVKEHPDPDPGHPCSHAYTSVSW